MNVDVDVWGQLNAQLTEPAAEAAVLTLLSRRLAEAEEHGVIGSWFFIRKKGWWRLRYQPGPGMPMEAATAVLTATLARLRAEGNIQRWVQVIYEPEEHAYGGPDGMRAAHQLFHADSRAVLAYRAGLDARPDHRRELALLLATALLRAAGQEWCEQGDVWARVAVQRPVSQPAVPSARVAEMVGRFLVVDTSPSGPLLDGGALAFAGDWMAAYRGAGVALGELAESGCLTRGLRALLAYLVLPAWNRLGLAYTDQHTLAAAARDVILGEVPISATRS
ncbi:thiopeptide-type bacteriocin biosynthesis protein [Micromonospora sp. NPDC005652]|uniref:thiopeptide-type bacteriocin biosynthesis protein n=1 Tax=Micromonospora sp. NPDC005652 TaxID=3157046 RepID=UPI0033E0EF12